MVDGPAYAGGMGLAGMCDVVLASRRASFAMPEVRIGLFPMIIVAPLVRALPRKLLMDMMFTGRAIDVDEADRAGFLARVCRRHRVALGRPPTSTPPCSPAPAPHAVRLGRRAFALLADLPADQALDAAQFLNLPFFLGSDLPEGAAAFLEKRPPTLGGPHDQEKP